MCWCWLTISEGIGNCEIRCLLLSLPWIQEYNLLVIGGCGSFMFPVEPAESFTSAKENYHSNWLTAEKNSFHGYILFQFILSLHLCDALNEHHFFCPVGCDLLVWSGHAVVTEKSSVLPWCRGEGIYPGCSVLTLIVIIHFNAKAYCYGVFQNDWTSRVNSF